MATRTIVYVDGFNLHYGALCGTGHEWLDLDRFFLLLRPHDDIRRIRYFTALLEGRDRIPQQSYLRALATRPRVQTTLGRFKLRRVQCRVSACRLAGARRFSAYEEKRTDVTIGIQMLDDAFRDECDQLILVSGDSDLVPAVRLVKERFPRKRVLVYVPSRNPMRGAAVELRGAADSSRLLPLQLLPHAQFADIVLDAQGRRIRRPCEWQHGSGGAI